MKKITTTLRRLRGVTLITWLLLLPFLLTAQNKTVQGTVTDEAGLPVAGVSVSVKNGSGGTSTNEKGVFSLSVPSGSTLLLSSVNYESKEVSVGDQSDLKITVR